MLSLTDFSLDIKMMCITGCLTFNVTDAWNTVEKLHWNLLVQWFTSSFVQFSSHFMNQWRAVSYL